MNYVWTIAASDSGGQAGIQADLKTFESFGVHGCSIITTLTAQNQKEVSAIAPSPPSFVLKQLEACRRTYLPSAIKIGVLGSQENVQAVANFLSQIESYVVLDPVLRSTSGAHFGVEDLEALYPHVDLLTPNLDEARDLTGQAKIEDAAEAFIEKGVKAVLIKGGHAVDDFSHDYFRNGKSEIWFSSPRIAVDARGTGCTLSSAIAANVALGETPLNAVTKAKAYLNRGLRLARKDGENNFLFHGVWPPESKDFPWAGNRSEGKLNFPTCERKLGFYPIVESSEWVARLAEAGTKTVQLRIKNAPVEKLEEEIQKSVELQKKFQLQLFINDYWQLAVKHGAYGVHLGQEDLETADLNAIADAGLRLGISTHSYFELSRAIECNPSYLALGPIFPTTCKSMAFGPQGFETLEIWRSLCDTQLVAIGGLKTEHEASLVESGVDGAAVITDVVYAKDWQHKLNQWLRIERKLIG